MAVSTYELTVTVAPKQDQYKIKHVKTSITGWYRALNVSALQEPMVMDSYRGRESHFSLWGVSADRLSLTHWMTAHAFGRYI